MDCTWETILICIENEILYIAEVWMIKGLLYAKYIFGTLLLLEFVVTGYLAIQRRGTMDELVQQAATKTLVLSFIWVLVIGINEIPFLDRVGVLPNSMTTFPADVAEEMAVNVSGTPSIGAVTPTRILGLGLNLAGEMYMAITPSLRDMIAGPTVAVFATGLITLLLLAGVFIRLAVELLKVTIESWVAMGAGAIMLGFLAFRGTAPMGEGYIRYLAYLAIKIFFLLMVVILAIQVGESALNMLVNANEAAAATSLFRPLLREGIKLQAILALAAVAILIQGLMALPDKLAQHLTANLSIDIKGMLKRL